MTNIIAILILSSQFQVAVEGTPGYHVATYEDSPAGIRQFFHDVQIHLTSDDGRFYPCVVYQRPISEILQSPLLQKIGPGTGHTTSLVNGDMVKKFMDRNSTDTLDARTAEKVCLSYFPPEYKKTYTASSKDRAFYRKPSPITDRKLSFAGKCEVILQHQVDIEISQRKLISSATFSYAKLREWAADRLENPPMSYEPYKQAFDSERVSLKSDNAPALERKLRQCNSFVGSLDW